MTTDAYYAVDFGPLEEDSYNFDSKEEAIKFAMEEQKNTQYVVKVFYVEYTEVYY